MKKHYRKEQDCANCGTHLEGKFCHACGQENLELHESFGHVMNHAISDYFHFDHQFFHTLRPLFFQPGKLTLEYMAGRRAQYLHPIKMYIFISLIFFLLFFKADKKEVSISTSKNPKDKKEAIIAQKQLDSLIKDPKTNGVEKKLLKTAQKDNQVIINKDGDPDFVADNASSAHKKRVELWDINESAADEIARKEDTTYELYLARQSHLSTDKKDNFFTRYVRKREYELSATNANVTDIIVEGVKHYAPKVMFLILPLFALLVGIAFRKNKKFYVEHLIYAFHFHCFLFLFLSIIMLIKMPIPPSWRISSPLSLIAMLVIMWYSYKSLRLVYGRSPGRTITKMIGLFFSYSLIYAASMLILVMAVALFD